MKKLVLSLKYVIKIVKKSVDKWQSFSKDFNNVRILFFHEVPRLTTFSA